MKMKLTFLLSAVLALTCASPVTGGKDMDLPVESRSRFAMLDDVRLLGNGLLQLGHSLREFVHKTRSQINDIFQKINIFDKSFYQLSVVTSEIREEEEQLKKTTSSLKANNEEIRSLSLEISSKMSNILQERSWLQKKVFELEAKLNGLTNSQFPMEHITEISALKDIIDTQEKCINDLLMAVRDQHEQLNHQKNKIRTLEEKLTEDAFQETYKELPSLAEYLHNSSTNGSFHPNGLPVDCHDVFSRGEKRSGVYLIKPNQSEPFHVYCEMNAVGGLTVIQRRQDGSVDFDQTWEKYEQGFGYFEREFWLGLRKILSIASQGSYLLRVELDDWKQETHFSEYSFTLDGPSSSYTIFLTHTSGNLPDVMANSTGTRFSTKDQDNSSKTDNGCSHSGGWWFSFCGDASPNGRYFRGKLRARSERRKGLHWRTGKGNSFFFKSSKITIRPVLLAGAPR